MNNERATALWSHVHLLTLIAQADSLARGEHNRWKHGYAANCARFHRKAHLP